MKAGGQADGRTGGRIGSRTKPRTVETSGTKRARRRQRPSARPPVRPSDLLSRLKQLYPEARCALTHRNAYELLCATILSAQCTDARVNLVTPTLFARYPTPHDLARANPADVEEIIRSTGFFRNKTKSLIGMARAVVERHGGEVPRTMAELRKLPGVGRKTANVILGNAYSINEGVTVDTHVARLSGLLGMSREADPVKIELDLMRQFNQEDWGLLSHLLIFHGRNICIARRPKCGACPLAELCPSARPERP